MVRRFSQAAHLLRALTLWWVLAAGTAAMSGIAAAERAHVVFHSQPVVSGPDILLGEIADVISDDTDLRQALTSLVVGRAAVAGMERSLHTGSVRVRMRQAGIPEAAVRLEAPGETVSVRTAARTVSAAELAASATKAVREALTNLLAAARPDVSVALPELTVSCPTLPEKTAVAGQGAVTIKPTGPVSFSVLSDTVTVPLALWVDGRVQQQLTARCTANAPGEVAVLASRQDMRTELTADMVRWERRNMVAMPAGFFWRTPDEKPIGLRLVRPQEAGVVITRDMVEPLPDAKRGQDVELVSVVGAVVVTDHGRLIKDARVGELVEAVNSRTGATVKGRLAEPGRVVVGTVPFGVDK